MSDRNIYSLENFKAGDQVKHRVWTYTRSDTGEPSVSRATYKVKAIFLPDQLGGEIECWNTWGEYPRTLRFNAAELIPA